MNLINFKPFDPLPEDQEWMYVKDFRKKDMAKIVPLLENMYKNIQEIDSGFKYDIKTETNTSAYLGDGATYYDKIIIEQAYGENSNKLSSLVPKLMYENFFILNGSLYTPLLFLEKAPIDRILNHEDNKDKIIINVNAVFNFTFDFTKKIVQFKMKQISMDIFFRVFFAGDEEYLEELMQLGFVTKTKHTKDERKRFVKSFLDFYKWEYFNDIDIPVWMDRFLMLDYYREIFNNFYGINTLQDIVKKVVEHEVHEIEIDMAKLSNRRVVMTEYLIRPLFEVYLRLLYNIIDKKAQNLLPSINEYAVITTGFNGLLHRGQLYDISNPFPLPLINKISQDIQIIKQGRLPKSWQRNDETGYGRLCPITVSPQNMGSNLVFTSPTKINKYGKVQIYQEDTDGKSED